MGRKYDFIRNNFIRNLTDHRSWYYVSTKVTPANLPTHNCVSNVYKKMTCIGMIQTSYRKIVRIGHYISLLILMKNIKRRSCRVYDKFSRKC